MKVLDNLIARLTDAYSSAKNTNTKSNTRKLLSIAASEIEDIKQTLNTISDYRDIDKAEGKGLDRLGNNVQQFRGKASDSVYRALIKTKIKRNMSDGSIDTLVDTLTFLLNVDAETIEIEERWDKDEPASIYIGVPTAPVNETGLTLRQFGQILNDIVVAGVSADVLFAGTFEFASVNDNDKQDPNAGFSDLAQETGGYFGTIYDPAEEEKLPL